MAGIYTFLGGDTGTTSGVFFLMALTFMFTPMLSVFLLEKLYFKGNIKEQYGIRFNWNKWWLWAWLLPLPLSLATFALSLLIPGVDFTPGMEGMFDRFEGVLSQEQLEDLRNTPMPIHPFFLTIFQGLIAGISINAVAGFGGIYYDHILRFVFGNLYPDKN